MNGTTPRQRVAMFGSNEAKELARYLDNTPILAFKHAAIEFNFDLQETVNELRGYGYQIDPYPLTGKAYGIRLVGGKWAK